MVLVAVGNQDQVRGQGVAAFFTGVRIDVDDFPFGCDDPEASVALVQQSVAGGSAFSRGLAAAQQEQGKRQDAAECFFHILILLFCSVPLSSNIGDSSRPVNGRAGTAGKGFTSGGNHGILRLKGKGV